MPIRNLVIWGVIALLLVALFSAFQPPGAKRAQGEWTYTELMNNVRQGNVREVVIQGNEVVASTVSNPGTKYITYVPPQSNLTQRLEEANVAIRVTPAQTGPSLLDILIGSLPMLLIFGAWFFFMRQMQSGGGRAMGFGKSK